MISTSHEGLTGDSAHSEQPYAGLDPDTVLEAAESLGFECDGRLFALNSYENRVYQIGTSDGMKVLKFYRTGRWSEAQILEEHSFTAELAAADLAVAAPLQFAGRTLIPFREFRFAIFPWVAGRAPDLDSGESREILGRALGRLHAVGFASDFAARPQLDIERYGRRPRAVVLASELLPPELGAPFDSAASALLERIERAIDDAGVLTLGRLHGDCHLGNLLWAPTGPVFVDLDDCMMGPAVQDLWMLISGDAADQQRQWAELIRGYNQFAELDFRELTLIESLRGMRMLHHAAWVVERWDDPAFPRAFPWFGEPRYWAQLVRDLLEQIAHVDVPPLLSG